MVYNKSKFDLNNNPAAFPCNNELNKNDHNDDTTLRLECYGYSGSDISRANSRQENSKSARGDGSRLVLGLGPTPSSYSNEIDSVLTLSLSPHSSTSKSEINRFSNNQSVSMEVNNRFGIHVHDEGSTSAKRSGGYMPSLILAPRISTTTRTIQQKRKVFIPQSSVVTDFSTGTISDNQTNTKKCKFTGCSKSARGKTELCIKHGGEKGHLLMCGEAAVVVAGGTAHGGGKRCIFTGCTKGAEGTTPLCKAHGGGKRCLHEGGGICPKSVHGGTDYCVAHGGGKRCVVLGCTKSARGRTNCCVKHGGGKRCKFDNCTKSAQGSTDFCKAHGGGKRCVWGGEGLFHGLVSCHGPGSSDNNSLSCASVVSNSTNWIEKPAKRRQLIPPQVLVPSSMKSSSISFTKQLSSGTEKHDGRKRMELVVPEGRVHGGGLLSLLSGNMRETVIDGI
ncbi:hypothetical protein Tco_0910200 [Tanacetum coccineum]|uniref:WRKY19-like zinc finger domain-containing protein n=1 Tax=Tanacetum coccineum TaxID=301880 RepID=A0ABQ5CS65_9ASTR